MQWATGNHLSWGHTDKSNYPYGETLGKPQFITSTIFIGLYKLFAMLSTPTCGINLMVLLGYMSTGLLMFGLIKWLLKRFDIALFAGFAAAFVPYHQLKAQSHINYIYGSVFVAAIWSYLWFTSRPSYRRAVVLGVVCSLGFYFDGYFILISAVLVSALFSSSFIFDLFRTLNGGEERRILRGMFLRLKHLLVAAGVLILLLIPIMRVYISDGDSIKQSLAMVRSDIKTETISYGVRPIEFIIPSSNSALVPNKVPWTIKPHGSNASEDTLYIGYIIILLAILAVACLLRRKVRAVELRKIPYPSLIFVLSLVFLMCFVMSLPAVVVILGHHVSTLTNVLIRLSANWRVLSRFFLAMHPAVVVLASLGLYMLIKHWSSIWVQRGIVAVCGLLLFLEYLPAPLHATNDLYKDAPSIYKHLRSDSQVELVAEYPLADFSYTPGIFTFQQTHNKTLLNSSDAGTSFGPFHSSIAGLGDPQTLGVLKELKVDVLITHGMKANYPALSTYYVSTPSRSSGSSINLAASMYSYRLNKDVVPRNTVLILKNGYESLSVDAQQKSHRFITDEGVMSVFHIKPNTVPSTSQYQVSFDLSSICSTPAKVIVTQGNKVVWSGSVDNRSNPVNLKVSNDNFYVKTSYCSVDVTDMSALLAP